MSNNMQLTQFFITEFYKTNVSDVGHLVSENFEYISHFNESLNFDRLLKMRKYLYDNSAIVHGPIKSDNDLDFVSDIEISTLEGVTARGVKTLTIENNKLRKIKVRFLLADDEVRDFLALLYKNYQSDG